MQDDRSLPSFVFLVIIGYNCDSKERDATSEKIEFVEDAHLPVVRILLHALADVNLQDDLGKSPLGYAAGSMKRARTLIAMEHCRDSKGCAKRTLHYTCRI